MFAFRQGEKLRGFAEPVLRIVTLRICMGEWGAGEQGEKAYLDGIRRR